MKRRSMLMVLCSACGLFCVLALEGQSITYTVGQFDANVAGYFTDLHWGTALPAITWDGNQNAVTALATNVPGSGSPRG